jgi:hypothetical protein
MKAKDSRNAHVNHRVLNAERCAVRLAYERRLLFWSLRQAAIVVLLVAFTTSIVVHLIAGHPSTSEPTFERLLWFLTG